MGRPITEYEDKWIKSMARLLKRSPDHVTLYAEGGGKLYMYDSSEYDANEAEGDCLGGLEPLGYAPFGPRFDCGGF